MTAAWVVAACALGGLGAALRVAVTHAAERRLPGGAPTATACVNVVGAAAIGVLAGVGGQVLLLVVGAGLLGGLTTFSTWMAEADAPLAAGRRREALLVLVLPVVAGVAACAAARALA